MKQSLRVQEIEFKKEKERERKRCQKSIKGEYFKIDWISNELDELWAVEA